ncbi:hypothetical protein [Ralstonia insidiosa]|uniref:Uncharacterized protein n=1 Tax=Ralstonia insidiosa TaxID=190721 RepID=A0A848P9Q2_9RALS|nr:hypothetical protein [Ralstonia insidiosa]NMV41943.1 hypothetical protein [Ralstonia insidiosa]
MARPPQEAIGEARQIDARRKASGFDQAALDAVAKTGFGDGGFEETEEEIPAIVEEFYNDSEAGGPEPTNTAITLKDKLDRKAASSAGDASSSSFRRFCGSSSFRRPWFLSAWFGSALGTSC